MGGTIVGKLAVGILGLGLLAAPKAAARPLPAAPHRERSAERRLVHQELTLHAQAVPEGDRARLAGAILDEAALARLDPLLVLAVIHVESGFDPGAVSRRGARGLMQLRPATLRCEAERSGLPGDDPGDPVLNVQAGVRYYGRLLRIFKSHDLALMAYNAGPNRISGYLRSGRIPDRFRKYPRRVHAEMARLKKSLRADLRIASVLPEAMEAVE